METAIHSREIRKDNPALRKIGRVVIWILLIALAASFFVGAERRSLMAALVVTGLVVLGVCMTLVVTRLLSRTILRGRTSSFTLELPPFRRPQLGRVLVRSVLDRTLFVLGRAALVAAW